MTDLNFMGGKLEPENLSPFLYPAAFFVRRKGLLRWDVMSHYNGRAHWAGVSCWGWAQACRVAGALTTHYRNGIDSARQIDQGMAWAAEIARGDPGAHAECGHAEGYWDGRIDAAQAILAAREGA